MVGRRYGSLAANICRADTYIRNQLFPASISSLKSEMGDVEAALTVWSGEIQRGAMATINMLPEVQIPRVVMLATSATTTR